MERLDIDSLEVKEAPMTHHRLGLSLTRTGYGSKLPTSRMVRIPGDNRWRRVYVTQYSNAGTCWIVVNGKRVIVS